MCKQFIILDVKIAIIFFNISNEFVYYTSSMVIVYLRVVPVTANVFIPDNSEFLTRIRYLSGKAIFGRIL